MPMGGVLYIGVNDNGYVTGISSDLLHLNTDDSNGYTYKQDTDGYEQRIRNAVKEQIGVFPNGELKFNFYKSNTNEVYCAVQIPAISRPVYVNETRLYQRAGIQTQILKGDDITKYIEKRLSVSKLSPLVEQAVPKTEVGSVEIEKGENNIPVVAPLLVASKPLNEKIWKYFTWYSNGDWSFQSTASKENDVMKEIAIYPSQKDMRLLMCYSSGHINPVIPKKVASKKSSGKRYKNGWHSGATLLDIFLAQPYDLIAAYSKSIEDTEMIKVHSVDHFNPKDSIQAAGPTIVNDRLGTLLKYKLIDVVNKQGILGLLETKARTSTSLGVRITSLPHKAEIRFLEEL